MRRSRLDGPIEPALHAITSRSTSVALPRVMDCRSCEVTVIAMDDELDLASLLSSASLLTIGHTRSQGEPMRSDIGVGRFGRVALAALLVASSLVGCGGGGGEEPVPPTALPPSLVLAVPPALQALEAPIAFSSNVDDPGGKLTYAWTFGDGATSALAAPKHAYAKSGDYDVTLTVTNEAGQSRTSRGVVKVADLAVVRGKACNAGEGHGWCWQRPLPQGNAVNDTFFVDGLRGWAVGESGTILATTDAGATWKAQVSGTQTGLYRVTFVDGQTGWVQGAYGLVLRTVDGGATWQSSSTGRSDTFLSFGASSANDAWVTTYYEVLGTTDGGAHWQVLPSAPSTQLLAVSTVSDLWGYSYGSGQPTFSHSRDGGKTWVNAGIPAAENGFSRYGLRMQFANPRMGVAMADESGPVGITYLSRTLAWQTSDAGASWQRLNLAAVGYVSGPHLQVVAADATFALTTATNTLRRTRDLGASWQPIPLPQTSGYWSAFKAYSATRLTVTDSSGRLFLTTDAGASWAERSPGSAALPLLAGLWFFDSREGLAIASDGSSIRTTDGGQSWTTTAPLVGSYGWQRMQFSATGDVGWVAAGATIYRSTDRGMTWLAPVPQTSAPIGSQVGDFHFIDPKNGWAVARYAFGVEPLFRTTDGGMSWHPVVDSGLAEGLAAIRFSDPMNGVATGTPGVAWVTADGGSSWTARPTGIGQSLRRLAFADATTVVAVGGGGAIVRSTDRGLNWARVAAATGTDLNDVRFVTASVGYAAGESGTLLKTVDGGLTWQLQDTSTTRGLQSVFFVDERTGWASGANGTILVTVNGGR